MNINKKEDEIEREDLLKEEPRRKKRKKIPRLKFAIFKSEAAKKRRL